MAALLPIFPLPGVVLFPGAEIPLHIFEPRYCELIRHATDAKLPIGLVLLKPGFQENYEGTPEIFSVGCMGDITACESLPGGRYNLLLKGAARFQILREDHSRVFRQAEYRLLPDLETDPLLYALEPLLKRELLGAFLALGAAATGDALIPPPDTPDAALGDLANLLAFAFPGTAQRRQALLELNNPYDRALALREFLHEMTDAIRKEKGLQAAGSPDRTEMN